MDLYLRKAKVIKQVNRGVYSARDTHNEEEITFSIGGKLRLRESFDLLSGETVFITVSSHNPLKGRLHHPKRENVSYPAEIDTDEVEAWVKKIYLAN